MAGSFQKGGADTGSLISGVPRRIGVGVWNDAGGKPQMGIRGETQIHSGGSKCGSPGPYWSRVNKDVYTDDFAYRQGRPLRQGG